MWFGKYDYKKNALYWEIKLPFEYSKARRLDFNRYIYNITKLNDKLLSFRLDLDIYLIDMENKQIISNFISFEDYSFPLFINTRTGKIYKNKHKTFESNDEMKILAPLLNYSNIYFPVMLYNLILCYYLESKKEKNKALINCTIYSS